MKKRIASLALALVMCLSLMPVSAFAAQTEKLPAPENIRVALDSINRPTIYWDLVEGAIGYEISDNFNWSDEREISGMIPANADSTLMADAEVGHHEYRVRAIAGDDALSSDWSDPVSVNVPEHVERLAIPRVSVSINEDGKPFLSWGKVGGAVLYEVRFSENGGSFQTMDKSSHNTLTHSDAKVGSTYTYQVRSIGSTSDKNSDWSTSVTITVPEPRPPELTAPDNFSIRTNPATGKPQIQWNAVEGAVEYEIYIQKDGEGDFQLFCTAKGTKVNHSSAKPGDTNCYKVRAVGADGTRGPWSIVGCSTCTTGQPVVTVSARSDGKPVLTWDKINDAVKYEVCYSTNGGDYEPLATVSGTKLNHTSAKPGNTYTYIVSALSGLGYGDSDWSEEVTFTVKAQSLTAPALTASNKRTTGKPYLKWDKVDGAAKYEVYRATSKNGEFTRLWSGSGTALTNGSAKAGTTYYYKVRAVAADGTKGPWSEIRTRTCDLAQPDVKVTTRSDGKPVLTWQKVSGAVKYEVYRRVDGGEFTRLSTVKGTKLTNGSAKAGHTYTYKVRAIAKKSAANSSYSYYDTITVK